MGKMKFHIYGQPGLVDLPDSTTVEDLRSLASFNRVIKNYLMMERVENERGDNGQPVSSRPRTSRSKTDAAGDMYKAE